MKKTIALMVMVMFLVAACGNVNTITTVDNDGKRTTATYDTYGLINASDNKNENIQYRLIIGNIVWACLLVETVIAPIYFIGFSLYEPVGVKDTNTPKGSI